MRLELLVALAHQLAQLAVHLQPPQVDLLQHDYELLDHLVLDQVRQLQSEARVQQLLQPRLVLQSEPGASGLALAEGGGLVAQVVEEEAEFEVRVFGRLVVDDALELLHLLYLRALWRFGLHEEVVVLAAAGEALLALLGALDGELDGVLEVLVVAVGGVGGELAEDLVGEGQHAGVVDGGLGLLAEEEDLVGAGEGEAGDDLAGPEGVILALGEDDLSNLILHGLHKFIS